MGCTRAPTGAAPPRSTSASTRSTACWSWDARSPSASPDPGRGRGRCAHDPDPCNTVALAHGADVLKLFPAEQLGPPVLKAWRAVFPENTVFIPVGGITPDNLMEFHAVGASGFGLGSALYKPGMSAADVGSRATAFVSVWRKLATGRSK